MRKRILAAAVLLTLASATPVFAGSWQQDQVGWYFQYDDGTYAKNEMKEIDGVKYYFDANGYMVTGWRMIEGLWTYFNGDGSLARGWVQDGGKWYYLNDNGTMKTGWFNDGKNNYYFYNATDAQTVDRAVEGAMATGTVTLSGVTYYFDANGKQDNLMAPFEQDGVKYRYREGALQWENINVKGDWIQYTSKELLAADLQELLVERYEGNRNYTTSVQFEKEAKQMLARLMDEDELELFIDGALEEYWGYKSSTKSEYEDEFDDYDYDYDWDF